MSDFICTRCGRRTFGEPALEGPQRKVCELCARAQREKHRTAARECATRQRARERAADDGKRVCGRCGEDKYIASYRRMGRGHSRCCLQCEETFGCQGKTDAFVPSAETLLSRRKDEDGGDNGGKEDSGCGDT